MAADKENGSSGSLDYIMPELIAGKSWNSSDKTCSFKKYIEIRKFLWLKNFVMN